MIPYLPKFVIRVWRALAFATLLVAGLALASDLWADDQPTVPDAPGSISGTVADQEGAPLPNIHVSLHNNLFGATVVATDAQGRYRFGALGVGAYRLSFRDPQGAYAFQYYSEEGSMNKPTDVLVAGHEVTGIDAALEPGGWITGIVTSAVGQPQFGSVYLYYPSVYGSLTFETPPLGFGSGEFSFRGLPTWGYYLCAQVFFYPSVVDAECYENISFPADPYVGPDLAKATPITVTAGVTTGGILMRLGDLIGGEQITGVVTSPDGKPAPKISVGLQVEQGQSWAVSQSAETDANGVYRLRNLPPGRYRVGTNASVLSSDESSRYANMYYNDVFSFWDAQILEINPLSYYPNIDFRLRPASHITGTLRIAGDVSAWGGTMTLWHFDTVGWYQRGWLQVNLVDGQYSFSGLQPGRYRLEVFASLPTGGSYHSFLGGATLEEADDIVLAEGETRANVNINLAETEFQGVIAGRVTANGQPVEGIRVALYDFYSITGQPPRYYTHTGSNGRYRIEGLTSGVYRIGFSDPQGDYATVYFENVRTVESATQLNIQGKTVISGVSAALTAGGSITGAVYYEDGTPLANVRLLLYWNPNGQGWTPLLYGATTDAAGRYELPGLFPDTYRLQFDFYTVNPQLPTLYYGGTRDLNFATDIQVKGGAATTGINLVLPAPDLFLPTMRR
jgi:protocatechuate 3,4-dioxygenase beta subunit